MANLSFTIKNSSNLPDDSVYLCITGDSVTGTLNGQAIPLNTWIQLSTIQSIEFGNITGGRVYAYYGTDPNFSVTDSIVANSPAFDKCFDKIEFTFDGSPWGVGDLTAIDFWSIPMNLITLKSGQVVAELHGIRAGYTADGILSNLYALCTPPQSSATGKNLIAAFAAAGHALPQGIIDQINAPSPGLIVDGSAFVRIIGPNSYPPFGNPASGAYPGLPFTPYNTFEAYFQYLIDTFGPGKNPPPPFTQLGNGKIAHLAGQFGGSQGRNTPSTSPQSYDLWATIDKDSNLTISGSGSVVGNINIYIDKWDLLNPAASYGGNPQFSLNGGDPQSPGNDLYAWILGDFFAGLNIGAMGSAVTVGGALVGEMPSQEWFKQLPGQNMLFNQLWPSGVTNYWNQWAQVLNPASDAYNFAYSERFSAPQISLNPANVDTLELELLPTPTVPA